MIPIADIIVHDCHVTGLLLQTTICDCANDTNDAESVVDVSERDPDVGEDDDKDVGDAAAGSGRGEIVRCMAHRLRAAILARDIRHTIAHLVSVWPHDTLRF